VWLIVVNITSGDPSFAFLGEYLVVTRGHLGFLFLSSLIVDMFIIVPGIWQYINKSKDIIALLMLWYNVQYKLVGAALGAVVATLVLCRGLAFNVMVDIVSCHLT